MPWPKRRYGVPKLDAQPVGKGNVYLLALHNLRVGRHAMGEPDVTAYDGAVANGDAPEQGRVGVDGNIVFDDGVARHRLLGVVRGVGVGILRLKILRPEGNALVEGNVVANDARLAYHHPRAM